MGRLGSSALVVCCKTGSQSFGYSLTTPLPVHSVALLGVAKKEAALHTIGYICEEIAQLETDCLHSKSNDILTAVCQRTDIRSLKLW